MNEFKEKLQELIIDMDNQELIFDDLSSHVQKWPEISFYNEDDNSMEYEALGLENCVIVEISDDFLEVIAGSDYQTPHLVRIEFYSGDLIATYFEPNTDSVSGMDFEEVIHILQS